MTGSSSPRCTESDSFLRIPGASPALPWLLYDVASLISGSSVQDRGGKRLEVMFLSWGKALSNSASPCIRCRKMALKSTSACLLQADRIYCAVPRLHESRRGPTESGSLYPDPGSSRHVLAEPLGFCLKLSAGMPLLSQGRLAEIGRIDFTINRRAFM